MTPCLFLSTTESIYLTGGLWMPLGPHLSKRLVCTGSAEVPHLYPEPVSLHKGLMLFSRREGGLLSLS